MSLVDVTYDFVTQLESELWEARSELRRVIQRTDALAELHSRALAIQAELNRPITERDVFNAEDEETRARLDLLVTRITGEES